MNYTYYLFAFYVFLLVCATIWFYGRVMRRSKAKDGAEEKERQLFKLYQNVEDMLGGFEAYAEEAKAAIDERLKQAEALMERADNTHKPSPEPVDAAKPVIKNSSAPVSTAKPVTKSAVQSDTEPVRKDKPAVEYAAQPRKSKENGKRVSGAQKTEDLISQYIAQGMDKAEIARALGKSQREISLMMEIKKINSSVEQD